MRPQHTARPLGAGARRLLAAIGIVALSLAGLSASAGAQSVPCQGDVVIQIDGVRLLNRDGARQAGPYPVQLEAGRYRIDAASFDYHTDDQIPQPNEQWQILTDSGWASGFTIDIPDGEQTTYTIFPDNTLPATSSVIVSHRGIDNINSVNPVCIGFTRLPDPGTDAADPEDTDPEDADPGAEKPAGDDPTGTEPGDDVPAEPAEVPEADDPDAEKPVVDDPDAEKPVADDPDAEKPVADDPDAEKPVADDPDDSEPVVAVDPPADTGTPDDEDTDAPEEVISPPSDEPIEPEVEGKVEVPDPTPALARTGPEDLTWRLAGLALVMIGLGGLAVRQSAPGIE